METLARSFRPSNSEDAGKRLGGVYSLCIPMKIDLCFGDWIQDVQDNFAKEWDMSEATKSRSAIEVVGGRTYIRGTNILVWSLVHAKRMGMTDAELMSRYGQPLDPADLQAVWKHYEQHRETIDEELRRNTEMKF